MTDRSSITVQLPLDEFPNMMFGKDPDQCRDDQASGVARIGGLFRSPSYIGAYDRAARLLVICGQAANKLDELALPIFYLQRHTTELLLKSLMRLCYGIAAMQRELDAASAWMPSNNKKKLLEKSHDLPDLLGDLQEALAALKHPELPHEVTELVGLIAQVETHHTWSRYDSSGPEGTRQHVADEVVVPVVSVQDLLKQVLDSILYSGPNDETSAEFALHAEWMELYYQTEEGMKLLADQQDETHSG